MERLTKRIGAFVYYTKGKYEDTIPAECETQDVRNILSCLAAYEDTGLEPKEIERIVDAYGRGLSLRTESAQRLEMIREIPDDRLREIGVLRHWSFPYSIPGNISPAKPPRPR